MFLWEDHMGAEVTVMIMHSAGGDKFEDTRAGKNRMQFVKSIWLSILPSSLNLQ